SSETVSLCSERDGAPRPASSPREPTPATPCSGNHSHSAQRNPRCSPSGERVSEDPAAYRVLYRRPRRVPGVLLPQETRVVGCHHIQDPVEILNGRELHGEAALLGSKVDLDAGLEAIGQSVRELVDRRRALPGTRRPGRTSLTAEAAHRDDLLRRSYGQSPRDEPLRETLDLRPVGETEQRSSMPRREDSSGDSPLD